MKAKVRFIKTSFLVSLLLFFLCTQQLFAANVLGRPRKMFLIKTGHFDIIYSAESEETAMLLLENADALYDKAAAKLNSQNNLHMPVIISPDSDVLSVDYTSSPYNRIIIFDSPADYDTAVFEDTLLSLFYREIFLALAQSIRSPFNQFLAKWVAGESYQPVAIFNLPYSFIEGIAYLTESEEVVSEQGQNVEEGRLHDKFFMQILAQAKLEGKFPNWMQVTAVRDTFPGEELAYAAGAGFSAFLMSTYGIEKYAQLWQESGKINPLLTQGVFYKTYGIKLDELWKEFESAVPLPDNLEELERLEAESKLVFPKDKEANYEHILLTDYGIVWYDHIRHEVDIYDDKNDLKIRQLLFLANNVERMSLSPGGRYISVSNTQSRTMDGLSSSITWIYDLKERHFLDVKYQLRDASIVITSEGAYAVVGVNVKESHARLEVYTLPLEEKNYKLEKIAEYDFGRNKIPFSPVYGGDGFIAFILAEGTERYLCRASVELKELEGKWQIRNSEGLALRIQHLSCQSGRGAYAPFYTFEFIQPQQHSFTRTGFIRLSENYEPQSVELGAADLSGGMNSTVVSADSKTLYYSARKYSINQLRAVARSVLPLEEGGLYQINPGPAENFEPTENAGLTENSAPPENPGSTVNPKVKLYNPFKYMADLSFTPFFPLKQIDLNEGRLYWPGLGLTVESQTDPCMNTRAQLSAGWTYLPLDFSWTNNIPSSYLAKIRSESLNLNKDKSAAFYIENTSTPVALQAGILFNCNLEGEYNFNVLAGAQWKLPVGIALRHFVFNVQGSYSVSTDYYDQTQQDIRPSLSDWPTFNSAYEMYQLSMKVEYSNIHQYGYSTFEKRGLSLGVKVYSMWDMVEVKLLQEAREEEEQKLQKAAKEKEGMETEEELTSAQKKNLASDNVADITQLNAALFATIAIPRLNPLPVINGWVLSMPAVLEVEFVNKAGTALESNLEFLLIGREIHNSLLPALLYSRRAGLWVGYNMALVYDTAETRLPDIRHENYLAEVFTGVSYTHAFYLVLNLDLNVMLGKLSSIPINTSLTGSYYPENRGYGISLDVRLHL